MINKMKNYLCILSLFCLAGCQSPSDDTSSNSTKLEKVKVEKAVVDKGIGEALQEYVAGELPLYDVVYFDLNSDGHSDAIVYLNDQSWCGTGGCTSLIFKGATTGFVFHSKIMITQKPILVAISSSHGWQDLIMNTRGFDGVILKFNGKHYPLNPSMQPLAAKESILKGTVIYQ